MIKKDSLLKKISEVLSIKFIVGFFVVAVAALFFLAKTLIPKTSATHCHLGTS